MDASEVKPHFTKELNEKSSKKHEYSKKNLKKNVIQYQKKQLNKFDNIEHIDDNYIEILKYQ